jgi:16S rRNA (guanine966-N2)-methyltransferase
LVTGDVGKFEVIALNAAKFLSTSSDTQFDIIFMDPPYELSNSDVEKLLKQILRNNYLHPNGLIAVERETKSKEFNWPAPLSGIKVRAYGQGSIYYGGNSASVNL